MSSPNDAKFWLQFFVGAGIPRSTATQYAITFSDNRIDSNMLSDLTKEYLNEMNITVIGDVIAILKHAGEVAKADYFTRKTSSNLSSNANRGAQLNSVVNRNPSASPSAAPNRNTLASSRPQHTTANVNTGKAATNSTAPNTHLPPDAGAHTMFIPPGARRKLAEAEHRRALAANNERSAIPSGGSNQHQQPQPSGAPNRVVISAGASNRQNLQPPSGAYSTQYNTSMQNLRVFRTPNGVRRVVSGRPQSNSANQSARNSTQNSQSARAHGTYMDDPRARDISALNRLGKRRSPAGAGGAQSAMGGVNFNVLIDPNSKRRKLSNGNGDSFEYEDVGMNYRRDTALTPRSMRDRLGGSGPSVLRTVVATGQPNAGGRVHRVLRPQYNVRAMPSARSADLRARLRGRRT